MSSRSVRSVRLRTLTTRRHPAAMSRRTVRVLTWRYSAASGMVKRSGSGAMRVAPRCSTQDRRPNTQRAGLASCGACRPALSPLVSLGGSLAPSQGEYHMGTWCRRMTAYHARPARGCRAFRDHLRRCCALRSSTTHRWARATSTSLVQRKTRPHVHPGACEQKLWITRSSWPVGRS